ncbi:hypothetical protein AMECASPLE_029331 [Ameca splendens]|uniref:Uncharacterized protein n=1 Tax=Ameca splendens TaxID=208324 RepID=A0ABV0XUK6_9TELE
MHSFNSRSCTAPRKEEFHSWNPRDVVQLQSSMRSSISFSFTRSLHRGRNTHECLGLAGRVKDCIIGSKKMI